MASLKLLAGLAGLAQGYTEIKEKKNEEAKQLIAARTKTAYQNYLKHQEQVTALKEEVKKRDAEARQFQPDLNDEERVAIATMPNAIDLYKRALAEGRSVGDRTITLRDILKVGEQAKGMKYDDFVNALGKVEPVQQVMMEPKTSFFGTSPEKQRRLMETMAGTVGVPAEQLMAFERPREAPRVEPMGALDIETMFAKEKKPEKELSSPERLESFKSIYLKNKMDKGEEHEDTVASFLKYNTELNNQKNMDDAQQRYNRSISDAKWAVVQAVQTHGAESPQHRRAMATLKALEGKPEKEESLIPAFTNIRVTFEGAISDALSQFGNVKGIAYEQVPQRDAMGNTVMVPVPVWTGDPTSPIYARMKQAGVTALEYAYKEGGLSKSDGTPANNDVKLNLIAKGIKFDNRGRPIFSSATVLPARGGAGTDAGQETPTLPPRNNVTTPPAAPAGAQPSPVAPQVAPAVRPGVASVPTAPTAASAVIPPGAIDMLKNNPKLAPDFDAKYGPGSAARILGNR